MAQGHEVTLFASGDSITSARLEPIWPRAPAPGPGDPRPDRAAYAADGSRPPSGRGLRRPAFPHGLLALQPVQPPAHPLRHHPARPAGPAGTAARLQHVQHRAGRIDLGQPAPAAAAGSLRRDGPARSAGKPADAARQAAGLLAFLGRIAPEKCPDRAIRIAQACGIPIKLAAKVDVADKVYFETRIKPLLDGPGVEMIGEISDREKPEFLSGAIGLLMPIDWPEPFGLVMIEAMACGTPVIAFKPRLGAGDRRERADRLHRRGHRGRGCRRRPPRGTVAHQGAGAVRAALHRPADGGGLYQTSTAAWPARTVRCCAPSGNGGAVSVLQRPCGMTMDTPGWLMLTGRALFWSPFGIERPRLCLGTVKGPMIPSHPPSRASVMNDRRGFRSVRLVPLLTGERRADIATRYPAPSMPPFRHAPCGPALTCWICSA